jgi:hypothetical protein
VIKNTTFLGLDIDSSLSQKNYIDQLMINPLNSELNPVCHLLALLGTYHILHVSRIRVKLGTACYAIRHIKHCMSQDTLSTIYFSYLHSFLPYGIIFGGNSAYSSNIFKIQRRVIMNDRNRDSFHQLFKKPKILTLKSQYLVFPYYS